MRDEGTRRSDEKLKIIIKRSAEKEIHGILKTVQRRKWERFEDRNKAASEKTMFPLTPRKQKEKHTQMSKCPSVFIPSYFVSRTVLTMYIYFYVQMLWMALGKARTFPIHRN